MITTICNSQFQDLLDAIAANNAPDYSALLTSILTEVTAVNANTDTIEASLTTLIASSDAGNVTLASILLELGSMLTELQAIDDNTDQVEALIQTQITLLQSEFDETQVLLQTLIDKPNIFKVDGCLPCPADPNEKANAFKLIAVTDAGVATDLSVYYLDGTAGTLADFGDCCDCN